MSLITQEVLLKKGFKDTGNIYKVEYVLPVSLGTLFATYYADGKVCFTLEQGSTIIDIELKTVDKLEYLLKLIDNDYLSNNKR